MNAYLNVACGSGVRVHQKVWGKHIYILRKFVQGYLLNLICFQVKSIKNHLPHTFRCTPNSVMDFANNNIGLTLNTSSYGNINALANSIFQMAKTGKLWTLGGDNCIYKIPILYINHNE